MSRVVVLDTETTGLNRRGDGLVSEGHRIIEIAAVEIDEGSLTGKTFHSLINPGCSIDPKAVRIHGITKESLKGKPEFKDIVTELLEFIGDAELVIHNAPFDLAFLDKEFMLLDRSLQPKKKTFHVTDTLKMARDLFPGADNTLDGLAVRHGLSDQKRKTHSALLDAEILAHVYLKLVENNIY